MDCVKRRRCDSTPAPSSKWADIPSEILDSIFEHLSLRDVIAAESVCTRWFSSAKSFITFKSQSQSPQCPLLLLFPQEDENGLENVPEEFIESACIGSSHGWLIFLDKRGAPLLFNPHLRIHIQLHYIGSLLGVLNIGKSREYGCYITYDCQENPIGYVKNLRENLIHKAIISSDPLGIKNFGAVVIYGYGNKLAYCKNGDDSWTDLDGKHKPYEDIICSKNRLCALGSNASVEVWDFDGWNKPVKRVEIEINFPEKSRKFWSKFGDLYTARLYLVESIMGDIMLVVRFVGELVNGDDQPVHEHDLLTEEDTHPLVCPYKTLAFHVYKLDLNEKCWVEVHSLGDQSLFLGGNHSISVLADKGYIKNSIYFTDDYWYRMDEDYLYGGHDMGVFSLDNGRAELFSYCHQLKIQPSPCWVNPSPW